MADLTLPGDIPGLERKGSPCIGPKGGRFIVHPNVGPSGYAIYDDGTVAPAPRVRRLDLSDPTGRAHAAWFVLHPTWDEPIHTLPAWMSRRQFAELMAHAIEGRSMEPHRIALLRRIVLHVAGRTL